MRRSTKSELRMLREVVHYFGRRTKCFFCHQPLLEAPSASFGHRDHAPIRTRLCIHHVDEDRENNQDSNLKPAHSRCHKRFHARKQTREGNKFKGETMKTKKGSEEKLAKKSTKKVEAKKSNKKSGPAVGKVLGFYRTTSAKGKIAAELAANGKIKVAVAQKLAGKKDATGILRRIRVKGKKTGMWTAFPSKKTDGLWLIKDINSACLKAAKASKKKEEAA